MVNKQQSPFGPLVPIIQLWHSPDVLSSLGVLRVSLHLQTGPGASQARYHLGPLYTQVSSCCCFPKIPTFPGSNNDLPMLYVLFRDQRTGSGDGPLVPGEW